MEILKKVLSGFLASSGILMVDCGAIFAQRGEKRNSVNRNMSSISKVGNSKIDDKVVKKNDNSKKDELVVNGFIDNKVVEPRENNKSRRDTVVKEGDAGVVKKISGADSRAASSRNSNIKRRTGLFFDDYYSRSFNKLLSEMDQAFSDFSSEFDGYFSNSFGNRKSLVSDNLTPVSENSVEESSEVKSEQSNQLVKKESFDLDDWSTLGESDGGKYEKFEQDTGNGKYLCESYVSKDGKTRRERRVFYRSSKT